MRTDRVLRIGIMHRLATGSTQDDLLLDLFPNFLGTQENALSGAFLRSRYQDLAKHVPSGARGLMDLQPLTPTIGVYPFTEMSCKHIV